MTTELKPCPFCGNEAKFCSDHAGDGHDCHHIVCTSCDAQFDMSGSYNPDELDDLKEYCAKSFNNRAEHTRQLQVCSACDGKGGFWISAKTYWTCPKCNSN